MYARPTILFPEEPGPGTSVCGEDGPREDTAELDGLLAAMGPADGEAVDLALDLRFAYQRGHDAASCVELAFRLRRALGDRHYLDFYRVRTWLSRVLVVEMGTRVTGLRMRFPLPLPTDGPEALETACLRRWTETHPGRPPHLARIRLAFASRQADANPGGAVAGQLEPATHGTT